MTNHKEFYSAELKYEILWFAEAECALVEAMSGGTPRRANPGTMAESLPSRLLVCAHISDMGEGRAACPLALAPPLLRPAPSLGSALRPRAAPLRSFVASLRPVSRSAPRALD